MIKIVLLGSGEPFLNICDLLNKDQDFEVKAIGTNPSGDENVINFINKNSINCINRLEDLDEVEFDFIYMLSYAPLIPNKYLDKYLFVNTHYAPLPRYRGFHGFVWSIINGEETTGFTIHKAEDGIDNGAIYYQYKKRIEKYDDVNSIMNHFNVQLISNIKNILSEISKGKKPLPQNENEAIYVTRRRQEDNLIDWNQSAINIHNFIRALTPPYTEGAFTYHNSQKINIIKTKLLSLPDYIERVGKIVNKDNDGIWVKTKDSVILITEISINSKIYKGGKEIELKIGNLFSHSKE
jgi:methionyl-tRNA formyltransferase